MNANHPEKRFDWPLCYDAENLVLARISSFLEHNSFAASLAKRMADETGTLMIDWVDYMVVSAEEEPSWLAAGFTPDRTPETPPNHTAFHHPDAMLPRVLLDAEASPVNFPDVLAVHPESIAEFITAHHLDQHAEGDPLARFRRVVASEERGTRFEAVERRGYRGFVVNRPAPDEAGKLLKAMDLWNNRKREFPTDAEGFAYAHAVLDQVIGLVGKDLACHLVFAGERAFWESRNWAARVQKSRQDKLGLGWGNHDHHTFRSSRVHFVDLMRALEKLGFERRERYYAGAQAGWGAQILEQPVEGIVAFCDVDLLPEETAIDFSRQPLPPCPNVGTIGLWVGLHGESFLQAGMHHLECRFDYDLLRDQLARVNVPTMKPFSDLPFLKQAFTEGERWPVKPERAERLLDNGLISFRQFDEFTTSGAIGSHLENLQRKGGFKGFNQKSVSAIIEATDPRRQSAPAHAV